jgi:16S rRNA pseudouridine516 synthase
MLLTNDGEFAHKVISPNKSIYKKYFVTFKGEILSEDIYKFTQGFVLSDGTKYLPAGLESISGGAIVTICEGKYHQVKRMMAAIGKPVTYLKRIAIGQLMLDESLKPGQYCDISDKIHLIFAKKVTNM